MIFFAGFVLFFGFFFVLLRVVLFFLVTFTVWVSVKTQFIVHNAVSLDVLAQLGIVK